MSDRDIAEFPDLPDRWQAIVADPQQLASQHLQDCQGEIHGYWDETDQFYETIQFKQLPIPQLISSSLGVTPNQTTSTHWLQLRYALTIPPTTTVGELLLILDDCLTVIDENWVIDVHSPYVVSVAS